MNNQEHCKFMIRTYINILMSKIDYQMVEKTNIIQY